MSDDRCRIIVDNVKLHGLAKLVTDDGPGILQSLLAAEACRRQGEFELSGQILTAIGKCVFSVQQSVQTAIHCHKAKLKSKDASPLPMEEVTFTIAASVVISANPLTQKCAEPLPPLLIRGWNFARAMTRWAGSGFEMRTQEEINERLVICQACPHLVNDHCNLCGCACVEKNQAMNKLALKTESCPIGKWS